MNSVHLQICWAWVTPVAEGFLTLSTRETDSFDDFSLFLFFNNIEIQSVC